MDPLCNETGSWLGQQGFTSYANGLGPVPQLETLDHMSKRSLGGLADLAKILEEASNPESELREDRQVAKPKIALRKGGTVKKIRAIDPKRMAWYKKRLKDQEEKLEAPKSELEMIPEGPVKQTITRAAADSLGSNLLMATLQAAKTAKPKQDGVKQRPEAWKRKPGDPIF